MKKKLLALLLCASMLFTVAACGDDKKEDDNKVTPPSITKLADYSDFNKVYTGDYVITNKVILEGFQELLASAGVAVEWVEVTDRNVITKDDIVKLDYTGYLDGEAFSGGSAKDQWISVGKNASVDQTTGAAGSSFIEGFTDGLIGAKVGDTIRHDVKFPENYGNESLNGKTTTFEFKIHGIYTMNEYTPENIDDAFVEKNLKEYYDVSTVEEVMEYVEEELRYQAFVGYMVANSTVDIPDSYLESRVDDYIDFFEEKYCSETLTLETLLQYYYGITLEDARKEWKKGLESQIKVEVIFAEIVKNDKLALDEEELEEYVQSILQTEEDETTTSSFFTSKADIFKYAGSGNKEVGEQYLLNEIAVKDLIEEKTEGMKPTEDTSETESTEK